MTELVFATNNPNKRDEVAQMLDRSFKVKTMTELGITEDIPEDSETLEGNAQLKARYVYNRYKVNVFADDTGLEVSALEGAPGVHTARYAGEEKDPEANISKLLHELENAEDRSARFRTVVCLIIDGQEYLFEGIATGEITLERSGQQGFGYDPIFRPLPPPPGYGENTSPLPTFAELNTEEKNALSHRGKAIRALVSFLNQRSKK